MSGPVEYDPDELDRAAGALSKAAEVARSSGRTARQSITGMRRFRGAEADKAKQRVDGYARALEGISQDLENEAKAMRRLAQAVRSLPRR